MRPRHQLAIGNAAGVTRLTQAIVRGRPVGLGSLQLLQHRDELLSRLGVVVADQSDDALLGGCAALVERVEPRPRGLGLGDTDALAQGSRGRLGAVGVALAELQAALDAIEFLVVGVEQDGRAVGRQSAAAPASLGNRAIGLGRAWRRSSRVGGAPRLARLRTKSRKAMLTTCGVW